MESGGGRWVKWQRNSYKLFFYFFFFRFIEFEHVNIKNYSKINQLTRL